MLDAIVIGGGPAGLAAATWLARYRCRVLVLDSGEYRNRWAQESHGYLGSDGCNPMELLESARADLARYGSVEIRKARAETARHDDDRGFVITTATEEIAARRVVLATGVADAFPEVAGFFDHYGRSVFHCPTCDGYEARERDVVAIGWSEDIAGFAIHIGNWARSVTIVTEGRHFEGDDEHRAALAAARVELIEEDAVAFMGKGRDLHAVKLRAGREVPCQLAFFTIGHRPVTDLAEQLGCRITDEGHVDADRDGRTSVEGVFAAGDLTPGCQLVQIAAGNGAAAGVACAVSLRHLDGHR